MVAAETKVVAMAMTTLPEMAAVVKMVRAGMAVAATVAAEMVASTAAVGKVEVGMEAEATVVEVTAVEAAMAVVEGSAEVARAAMVVAV